jgi:hypothetical protein
MGRLHLNREGLKGEKEIRAIHAGYGQETPGWENLQK